MADTCSLPFASKSLTEHIVRGVIGVVAMVFTVALWSTHPLIAVTLFVMAIIALRGCPMCWLTGLLCTIQRKRSRHAGVQEHS